MKAIEHGKNKVTISRKDGEFICRMWIDGKRYPAQDYFTNDKVDAIATAEHMAANNIPS